MTTVRSANEQLDLIRQLKAMGAKRIKVEDCEVEFADEADGAANADMMRILENGIEQGRGEVMRHLTPDQRARIEQMLEQDLITGSS